MGTRSKKHIPFQKNKKGDKIRDADDKNKPLVPEGLLKFSFKYLDLTSNPKFCLDHCKDGYLNSIVERLRDVSHFSYKEFVEKPKKGLRNHEIIWSDTTESDGFTCLNEQLRGATAFQFSVSSNEHGRIHGFVNDKTFFVIWLDPKHLLYS